MGIESEDVTIERVCASAIVRQALEERRHRGYSRLDRWLVREGYAPGVAAVIIRFACPPRVIELPVPALRAIFFTDTLEVLSLADPYVVGASLGMSAVCLSDRIEGRLPFVLAVPTPRSFPIHENRAAEARRREERWAAARRIDLASLRQ